MRLARQISQMIGLAGTSVLLTSIARAAGASVPYRINGSPTPSIVSDSVTVEFAGFLDRLGLIATTTGFILALIASVFVLVMLAGARETGKRSSKRATRTRPDNVIRFDRQATSRGSISMEDRNKRHIDT